jgi:cell division GTPase FtsZ
MRATIHELTFVFHTAAVSQGTGTGTTPVTKVSPVVREVTEQPLVENGVISVIHLVIK